MVTLLRHIVDYGALHVSVGYRKKTALRHCNILIRSQISKGVYKFVCTVLLYNISRQALPIFQ